MAKLVDALVSGTSVSNDVQVRVLFWAQEKTKDKRQKQDSTTFYFYLFAFIFYLISLQLCPDGEIGRHASLRGWCRLRCASSSLVLGTKKMKPQLKRNQLRFFFY
jgi:hypothetical protein